MAHPALAPTAPADNGDGGSSGSGASVEDMDDLEELEEAEDAPGPAGNVQDMYAFLAQEMLHNPEMRPLPCRAMAGASVWGGGGKSPKIAVFVRFFNRPNGV